MEKKASATITRKIDCTTATVVSRPTDSADPLTCIPRNVPTEAMIKAPVFAFIIASVGTFRGMQVTGSAESVGRLTTVAVVQSIFLVILADAFFSILFAKMGI